MKKTKPMKKKIFLSIIALVVFMLINYALALFAPTAWGFPGPVWLYTGDTVKEQYFKKLKWYEKLSVITMTYEGGNIEKGKGGLRTEKSALGTPEFEIENQNRMENVGKCALDGNEGYWEFHVVTFSFFNIPVKSETINCNNGLAS